MQNITAQEYEKNNRPIVNVTGTIAPDMTAKLPAWHPIEPAPQKQIFSSAPLRPKWVYVRNPQSENYENRAEGLLLHGTGATLDATQESPTMVLRRQRHINCEITASLSLRDASQGDEAGLCVFLDAGKHYDIFLRHNGQSRSLVLRYRLDYLTHIEKEVEIGSESEVLLRIVCTADAYSFLYSTDEGKSFVSMGTMASRYLSEEVQGGFTGCLFGLYCISPLNTASARFGYFQVKPE